MNVLWLASGCPNRTNITNGDFIERHAKAVAPFVDTLTIIAVIKDDAMAYNTVEIEEKKQDNITTYIVYYGRSKWSGAVEKLLSVRRYISLHEKLVETIIKDKGKPQLVHVNVAMKAGLVAKKLKKQYNIPYIITEHWTGYYKKAKPNIFDMGDYFFRLTRSVLKNASLLLTVSEALGKAINKDIVKISYKVLPNVVDTTLFYPEQKQEKPLLQLIHISSMEHQKNVEAIIKALAIWKKQGGVFMMNMYGPVKMNLQEMVKEYELVNEVLFQGEVLQHELAPAVRKADALVLYSRYETFGCVLIEANACGVPVIVSDLQVFHEFITENVNGVFVQGDNPAVLSEALHLFAKSKNNFDKKQIAAAAKERFCYEKVGQQIKDVYADILKK
jgi:glycosyltransferase involved in cell wall biosynthesis